jgi:hypothetical protein
LPLARKSLLGREMQPAKASAAVGPVIGELVLHYWHFLFENGSLKYL